jgi:AcrR family transcriptional regulator
MASFGGASECGREPEVPRTPTDHSSDGRVRRGARNRTFIMDAIFELVQEGVLQPTAEQVAQRAGVGTRTVFRHYDDMESLFGEMQSRLEREVRPLLAGPPIEGPVEERVRQLVARRARIFERITPFRRSANVQPVRSRLFQDGTAELDREMRQQLRDVLTGELRASDDDPTEALDMIASFEAWDRLRSSQRLGRERAQRVVEQAVLAVLRSK